MISHRGWNVAEIGENFLDAERQIRRVVVRLTSRRRLPRLSRVNLSFDVWAGDSPARGVAQRDRKNVSTAHGVL